MAALAALIVFDGLVHMQQRFGGRAPAWALTLAALAEPLHIVSAYGLFAAKVRDHVVSRPKVMAWLRRAFAGGFALLGAKLAFAER